MVTSVLATKIAFVLDSLPLAPLGTVCSVRHPQRRTQDVSSWPHTTQDPQMEWTSAPLCQSAASDVDLPATLTLTLNPGYLYLQPMPHIAAPVTIRVAKRLLLAF